MRETEILPDESGTPRVTLHGDTKATADSKGIKAIHISGTLNLPLGLKTGLSPSDHRDCVHLSLISHHLLQESSAFYRRFFAFMSLSV